MGSGSRFRQIRCDIGLSVCLLVALAVPAGAQAPGGGPRTPHTAPRETIIGGSPSPLPKYERCIEVEIGGDRAFGCLNQQLKREVDRVNPSFNMPPLDARSSDLRVGNVNEAAVRQQYGSNYGRSVYPFRPPPLIYAPPRR
jgi:hypothetical protein